MENPNCKTVNIRRFSSLPTQGRSSFLSKLSHKSNPYVGTFRHSPPTSAFSRISSLVTQYSTIGHPSKILLDLNNQRFRWPLSPSLSEEFRRLLFCEASYGKPRTVNGLYQLRDLLSGNLRGGGGDIIDWPQFQKTLQKQSNSDSGTVQVLSRLAYWLIRPFRLEATTISKPYYDDNSSMVTDSPYYEDTEDEDDDLSSLQSSVLNSPSMYGTSSVISSQAEAYYAHQATSSSKDILAEDHRLDDTITQGDIIRMMRNASRHLDVDSIVQLPVITYQTETRDQDSERDDEQDMSWLLVSEEVEESRRDDVPGANKSASGEDQDFCVICLEHFRKGDRLRVLPCDHSFHVGCIDRWLSGSHSFDNCFTTGCPTCKKRADANLILDGEVTCTAVTDGSVPSWAFSRIGEALARSSSISS